MRKLAITMALASTVLATPAVARDKSFYAGIEGGVMWVEDMDVDYVDPFLDIRDGQTVTHHSGYDIDGVAGYDFGMIRLEAEVAYKQADVNQVISNALISGGFAFDNFDSSGSTKVTSGMVNALIDMGNEDGLSGYAGVGLGIAQVDYKVSSLMPNGLLSVNDSYNGLAWQGIIGLRYAVSPNIDVGMKYRYFNVPNVKYSGDLGGVPFDWKGRYRSHSVLASLIYNFAAPPPPPPPPPPRPAASAASRDADVPGRFGDPGDGQLPGSASASASAASGAGTRSLRLADTKKHRLGPTRSGPVFFCACYLQGGCRRL